MPMKLLIKRYDSHFFRTLLLLSGLGFIAHVLMSILISPIPQSDALDYHNHALRLAENYSFTSNGIPTAYRPIGFPAVLSVFYMIWTHSISGFILQSFLVSCTALLLALHLKDHQVSNGISYAGLILYLLLPMTWIQSMTFMSEPLAIACMMLGIYIHDASQGMKSRFMEGFCWGIAILTRPIMVFSVIAILIHDFMKGSRNKIIACSIGILIVILPWMIRNAIVMGSPMIASNTGINLYIGHHPEANGSYHYVEEMNRFDHVSEVEASTSAMKSALQFIMNDPLHSILLIPKKIAFLFASDAYLPLQSFDISGNTYTEKMHNLPWWSYLLIIPGGLIMCIGMTHGKELLQMNYGLRNSALIIGMIIPCAIFFGTPRYHEPMIPFMLIALLLGFAKRRSLIGTLTVYAIPLFIIWLFEYYLIFSHS
ncbi:MAG: hypothetical protein RIT37_173 [Bacteroidota bacterium]